MRIFLTMLALLFVGSVRAGNEGAAGARAQRQVVMELTDGTRVVGRVAGVQAGVYTVVLDAAGERTRQVAAAEIKTLSFVPVGARPPLPVATPKEQPASSGGLFNIEAMRERLLANPKVMAMMTRLAADKEIQKVLADDELARQIENGEYLKLMANPKFRSLLENETMKSAVQEALKGEKE